MRRFALTIAIMTGFLVSASLTGGESRDDWNTHDRKAVEAYRAGDLDTARTAWLAVIEPEDPQERSAPPRAERARILYDLGNVAFRKGSTLEAVGWYTASLRLRPRDADAWANLEHARSEAKLEPADRGDLSATLTRVLSSFTRAESEWLVILGALLWAGVLAMEAVRGGRLWRRLAWLGAVCVLLSLSPWMYNQRFAERDTLISIEPKEQPLQVRSEPRADAAVIADVAPGEILERKDALPEWTKVELDSGLEGWVKKSSVFALSR